MFRTLFKLVGFILLIAVGLGIGGYVAYIKPDAEVRQQLRDEFGEDFFDLSSPEKSQAETGAAVDDSEAAVAEPEAVADNGAAAVETKGTVETIISEIQDFIGVGQAEPVEEPDVSPPEPTVPDEEPGVEKMTQKEIIAKYTPQVTELQNRSLGRMEELYAAGRAEYDAAMANGAMDKNALAHKYIQAGTMIEGATDQEFAKILRAAEADLVANGLSTDIIGDIQGRYSAAKAAKRSEMLGRVGL